LAGGVLRAGKSMKENVETKNHLLAATSSSVGLSENNPVADRQHDEGGRPESVGQDCSMVNVGDSETGLNDIPANIGNASIRARPSQRSASLGSLEDLSHMMHPSAIVSRLYNVFSNNGNIATDRASSPDSSTANLDSHNEGHGFCTAYYEQQEGIPSAPQDENNISNSSHKRRHRSKRSHQTLLDHSDNTAVSDWKEKMTSEPGVYESAITIEEEENYQDYFITERYGEYKTEDPSPEEIAHAMEHPFSTNPYDHPSPPTLSAYAIDPTDKATVAAAAASFFSFNRNQEPMENGNVPTGCVGAYARAVNAAASKVTRHIKASRKSNSEALSPEKRHELGVRFIDACTSDTKLHVVKEILRRERACMDVDRFFIGPDDTETCALHAAAFNGAERVLQFLCGGIDEHEPDEDCGLCDVNVQDGNGWTALHFAAGANSTTSVGVLSRHGANLRIEASNGYTPFHWAERLSNEDVAGELEKLGADNRFVGGWMFGSGMGDNRKIPFVSFLANRFFAFNR